MYRLSKGKKPKAIIYRIPEFDRKTQEWKQQGLKIFFLPTYSPYLNLIETLWRKIKYEWLKPRGYLS